MTQYYMLGRTGLAVSRLSLGAMTFGTEWGWGADKQAARRIFDCYLDHGGNFVDTANLYTGGTSERWLGDFIRDSGTRDRVVLATKFTGCMEAGNPNAAGNGRKYIMRAVEDSLQRLGTDFIDLYILHSWDKLTPVEDVMRTLDDLVRAGKIRHMGFSNVPGWYAGRAQTLAELRGWEPVSSIQLEYSLLERTLEHEFTDLATLHGCAITAWSPLAGGILSGKYRPGADPDATRGRIEVLRGTANPFFNRGRSEQDVAIIAELERVAAELGRSMAQVAVNWVANRPGVASVILGATKLDQLRDTLQSLEFTIPAELMGTLDRASRRHVPSPYLFFTPPIVKTNRGGITAGRVPPSYGSPTHVTED
jgi:aryl-alcohol dehydrogenase-like predicted oxidoreductase